MKTLLIIVFILGLFFRFYDLGGVPVGFHRDEAFLGYNAYSILKTGRDISGNFLPIHLDSFLFSPAGYSYTAIPFIAIFGLNELSVRFSSAFFGSLTLFVLYFLVRKLFEGNKFRNKLSLFSVFFLAISPWHINLSRVSTENTVVVFFITLGTLLILYWFENKKNILLFGAFAAFTLTLFLYQAPRAFLPLYIPLLFAANFNKKKWRHLAVPVVLYILLIVIPIAGILSSYDLSERMRMLSIFNHPGTQLVLNEQIREEGVTTSPLITRIFHNKLANYSATFIQNYANHFSFNFLFIDTGLPDRYRVPGFGLLYLYEIFLILAGVIFLYKTNKKIFILVIGSVLLAPIGSALTYDDVPNLQRTLIVFPALSILIGSGFYFLYKNAARLKHAKIIMAIAFIIIFYNLFFYLHQYYVHQVYHRPWFRQEGYKELFAKLNKFSDSYKKIYITDSQSAPLILYLFYNKYDPVKLQTNHGKIDWSKPTVVFEKYVFGQDCPLHTDTKDDPISGQSVKYLKSDKGALYVNSGTCPEESDFVKTVSEVKRKDGNTVFKIVKPAN